jgi:DNA polymerase-1
MAAGRLFLIDAFGFVFRAYHARARSAAPMMRTSSGQPTEAAYIFNNMLRKLIANHQPEYMAAVFESAAPTFREREFAEYKANRPEMPEELASQIPYIRRILEAMQIPVLEYEGYEADDVIGAISRWAVGQGLEVVIVSSDKDMLQLVSDRVRVLNPIKNDKLYDPAAVEEEMGVRPEQIPDLLALKGDAIDNIPGAPGIGEKGARELIRRFGTVEAALERAAEVERRTYRESLINNRDLILLSKRLATINPGAPIEPDLDRLAARPPDVAALRKIYKELEFYSLLKELGPEADQRPRDYRMASSVEEIQAWLAAIPADAPVAIAWEVAPQTDGLLAETADGQGRLALAFRPGEVRCAPLAWLDALRPWLEDENRPKATHDLKSFLLLMAERGIRPAGFRDDVMLYAFLLTAEPSACGLEAIVRRYLDRQLEPSAEHRADCILEAAAILRRQVDEAGLRQLYETIDLPLTPVLARMERTGIRIDPAELERLSGLMQVELERLTAEIHALAGRPFNINSPQQLGKVLFEELKLPAPTRYGKGKTISTAADVLEELAPEHEIVRKVLEYRQLAKLKGTYVDALPALINPRTGRLHTSFNQTGAATGRLSSSNPNLQNIPIRTELGRQIRAAFIPREGWKLVVADYSQIELRLLAHFSRCPVLVEAFRRGEDIHTRTAAEVFGVPPLMVTPEMRRRAKAVNFGIIYGQTAFGLAAQLDISKEEAQAYIDSYFQRYAGVKEFIETTIAEVRRTGYTRTLFGRRRPIPDINSPNPSLRNFAERTAVNTPLQGTAADLIKLAMIRIQSQLDRRGLRTAMLLQVHDELLFESPPEEIQEVSQLVRHEMENVHELEVPLVAEIGVGDNWRDAK